MLGSVRVIGGPPIPESSSTSGLAGRPSSGYVEVHSGHIDGPVVATTTAGADGTFKVGVPAEWALRRDRDRYMGRRPDVHV